MHFFWARFFPRYLSGGFMTLGKFAGGRLGPPRLSPNAHPSLTQGSARVIGRHPTIVIFQPTHAGLKMPVLTGGPYRGADQTQRYSPGLLRNKFSGTQV